MWVRGVRQGVWVCGGGGRGVGLCLVGGRGACVWWVGWVGIDMSSRVCLYVRLGSLRCVSLSPLSCQM